MSTGQERLVYRLALAMAVVIAGCTSNPSPTAPSTLKVDFGTTPISSIALDEYASGGILTAPPGTEFALQLGGGGWTISNPADYQPFRLVRGPGDWFPGRGYLGPGNCASASPCGGQAALFKTTKLGYGELNATTAEIVFELHLVVKEGPITLDLQAVPIINESEGTSVTMPIGSTVTVHLIGNWAPPKPDAIENDLFAKNHLNTSGVVNQIATGHVLNESVYRYSIFRKGAYAVGFKFLDYSPFAQSYTIGFDIL